MTISVVLFVLLCTIALFTGPSKPAPVAATTPAREAIDPTVVYNLVNDERQKAGVGRLSLNPKAVKAAESKCQDMVANDYYEHVNPKTGVHGYQYTIDAIPTGTYFNENLTQGTVETNALVVKSWVDSPDHKATMLEPKFTDTGVAVCKIPSEPENSRTVVQEFVEVKATPPPSSPSPSKSTYCTSTPNYSYSVNSYGPTKNYTGTSTYCN